MGSEASHSRTQPSRTSTLMMLAAMQPSVCLMSMPIDDMLLNDLLRAPMRASRNDKPLLVANEDKRTFTLTMNAPGVRAEDLSVSVQGDKMTIHGESKAATHTHVVDWKASLPDDADAQQSRVSHVDGVITITIPRKEAAEPMRIEVSTESIAHEQKSDTAASQPDNYTLTLSAPGISASDLELVAQDGMLRVSGASTRTGARVDERFRLPRDADIMAACASHIDGLLTMCVPKKPAAEAKMLAINEGAADFQMV